MPVKAHLLAGHRVIDSCRKHGFCCLALWLELVPSDSYKAVSCCCRYCSAAGGVQRQQQQACATQQRLEVMLTHLAPACHTSTTANVDWYLVRILTGSAVASGALQACDRIARHVHHMYMRCCCQQSTAVVDILIDGSHGCRRMRFTALYCVKYAMGACRHFSWLLCGSNFTGSCANSLQARCSTFTTEGVTCCLFSLNWLFGCFSTA
jgi:hypothetical protein